MQKSPAKNAKSGVVRHRILLIIPPGMDYPTALKLAEVLMGRGEKNIVKDLYFEKTTNCPCPCSVKNAKNFDCVFELLCNGQLKLISHE